MATFIPAIDAQPAARITTAVQTLSKTIREPIPSAIVDLIDRADRLASVVDKAAEVELAALQDGKRCRDTKEFVFTSPDGLPPTINQMLAQRAAAAAAKMDPAAEKIEALADKIENDLEAWTTDVGRLSWARPAGISEFEFEATVGPLRAEVRALLQDFDGHGLMTRFPTVLGQLARQAPLTRCLLGPDGGWLGTVLAAKEVNWSSVELPINSAVTDALAGERSADGWRFFVASTSSQGGMSFVASVEDAVGRMRFAALMLRRGI